MNRMKLSWYHLADLGRLRFNDSQNLDRTCFPNIAVPSQNEPSIRTRNRMASRALTSMENGEKGVKTSPANQIPESPMSPMPIHFFQATVCARCSMSEPG